MTDLDQKEVFIDIKGYEGLYQISNKSNIKRLSRSVVDKNGVSRTIPSKFLKADENHRVRFYKNKKASYHRIKDLVFDYFEITDNPEPEVLIVNKLSNITLKRLTAATSKLDDTARTVRLLELISQSNWKIYSASEKKQIFRALAEQRDTLRRHNKDVERIVAYNNNERVCRGNLPQGLKS